MNSLTGIVMGNKSEERNVDDLLENRHNLLSRVDSSQLNDLQLSSIMQNVTISTEAMAPEIRINSFSADNPVSKMTPPSTLRLEKKNFSRSTGEVTDTKEPVIRPTGLESNSDVRFSISQSQSESALKSIVSPIGTATKEMVLSPFTKFAKGVQNIASMDPRKLSGQVRYVSERDLDEHRKLQEKWQNSKTRLIAL